MSFMVPEIFETDFIEIEGPMGIEIVPCDIVDFVPTADMAREPVVTESHPPGDWVSVEYPRGAFHIPTPLRDFCENHEAWSIRRRHGWLGRFTAPGYMDATGWISGETEEEVRAELREGAITDDEDDS